jgi:hypothetical protein
MSLIDPKLSRGSVNVAIAIFYKVDSGENLLLSTIPI